MSRKTILDYFAYLALRLAICLIQALPAATCGSIADRLAALLCLPWLARQPWWAKLTRRDVALDNLRHAFPNRYSDRQVASIVRGVYRHFLLMIAEIAHIPRKLRPGNYRRYLHLAGERAALHALMDDRPTMLVGAHFGNWELAGYAFGMYGVPTWSVARPLDNPYVDRFLARFRGNTGQRMIPKKGGSDQMVEVLARGENLALLADQNAGSRGMFVEFFGRPASTHKGIALLALQYRCRLLIGYARRTGGPLEYEVVNHRILDADDFAHCRDPVRELTQAFTTALEQAIRTAPEQYLWLHRRWKSRPGTRTSRARLRRPEHADRAEQRAVV